MDSPGEDPHTMSLGQALFVIPTVFLFIRFILLPIVEPIARAVSGALFQ